MDQFKVLAIDNINFVDCQYITKYRWYICIDVYEYKPHAGDNYIETQYLINGDTGDPEWYESHHFKKLDVVRNERLYQLLG
jgi:hypothetical protein